MAKKRSRTSSHPYSALVLRAIKQEVSQKAGDLIEKVLKPRHIQPPPKGHPLNDLISSAIAAANEVITS
jgi:hypothetical protein